MDFNFLYISVGASVLALAFAVFTLTRIMRRDPGDAKMQEIARQVQIGAKAFLHAEYKWVAVFILLVTLVMAFGGAAADLGPKAAIAFACGAIASASAGYFGMYTSTRAAVRCTQAAKTSLGEALQVAFGSGTVMGMTVVGLAMLGLCIFTFLYTDNLTKISDAALNSVLGFSFGASSIALFARVGGGIYTKAADIGGDLVGKLEAGIPEDDPRNPAVIADNVGDNVGDVAGMGADLFESYTGSIVAAMSLGFFIFRNDPHMVSMVSLPLAVSAVGILASILGVYFVKAKDESQLQSALFRGLIVASIITAGATAWLCNGPLPLANVPGTTTPMNGWDLFIAINAGLVAGVIIGKLTDYYTSASYKPVKNIAFQSQTGPATNIIHGLATGMESVALPVIFICAAIWTSFHFAGIYGVAMSAVGMLSTLGISLAVDAYGPVADNAGGMAEMAHLPKEVRQRTDSLDACGNTTAAIGKGFAIGSAALTALALFSAYCTKAGELSARPDADPALKKLIVDGTMILNINTPMVTIGLLIGGFLPFLFSAMTMRAVGNAANKMVEEVRRQFREIKGLMEGTGVPDTQRCVAIATEGALKQMVVPGVMAVAVPILIGKFMGVEALGGMLAGALVSSVMLAIFMANAGGAWDNAKKFIEAGEYGGKGGAVHKAAVVGDTVGDPFKDTSGPSLNILIKLMTVVGVIFLPWFL
ncbi:MAG TPA: sodium-translocating pyrophosphatase [Planctomycetota bacterium]|nr:sodium-translocating pyrophosphatase [Planctomycetota bacterium]